MTSRRFEPLVSVGATLALAAALLVTGGTQNAAADPAPVVQPAAAVTADRLPTVQIDGVVWSQVVVGNTVYAGGRFNNARPAGAAAGHQPDPAQQPARLRHHHRQPDHVVRPDLNGQVLSVAASPDGTRIYAVGDFTTANGQARRRVAAYSTATGALDHRVQPVRLNSQARAVIATNGTVYVGGGFPGLATAPCATTWPPSSLRRRGPAVEPERRLHRLGASPSPRDGASVFAGGSFQNVGGQAAYGLAKIDARHGGAGHHLAPVGPQRRPRRRHQQPAGAGQLRLRHHAGTSAPAATWRAPSRSRSATRDRGVGHRLPRRRLLRLPDQRRSSTRPATRTTAATWAAASRSTRHGSSSTPRPGPTR